MKHVPSPVTPTGALFYAALGATLVSVATVIMHHVHIVWS